MPQFSLSKEGFNKLKKKLGKVNKQVVDPSVYSVVYKKYWPHGLERLSRKRSRKKEANEENNKFLQKMGKDMANVFVKAIKPYPE